MDCEWELDETCLGEDWETYDPDVQTRAASLAVDTLRRLTAFRVGGCPITVRPSRGQARCFIPGQYTSVLNPGVDVNGNWVNCAPAHRYNPNEVALPPPVGRVDEVKVDGVVVAPANYRIDNGHLLVWRGVGNAPWPQYQDVTRDDNEVGTFSVTYLNGYPVGSAGRNAAGILAAEYAKACSGKSKCRLPAGVTTIVRQGITMEIASGAFPGGLTGIREIDAFIALWNPARQVMPTRVWSPDTEMRRTGI